MADQWITEVPWLRPHIFAFYILFRYHVNPQGNPTFLQADLQRRQRVLLRSRNLLRSIDCQKCLLFCVIRESHM